MTLAHFFTPSLFSGNFIILCAAALLFFASYHLLSPVLPLYFKSLAFKGQAIGALMAVFMVASIVVRPWAGKLADEISRKGMMLAGLAVFAISSLIYPFIEAENAFFGVRILHGIGFALTYTGAMSYLIQRLPADHKAEGISYFSTAIKIAMAFSPGLGLFLAQGNFQIFGLPLAFVLAAAFSLMALGLVVFLEPSGPAAGETPKGRLFNAKGVFPGAIMASNSIVFGALIPFIPFLAHETGMAHAGWFYTVYALALISSRTVTGRISDVYGRNVVVIPGMLVVIASLWLMGHVSGEPLFLFSAALYGLSAGTVQPSLVAIAADRADSTDQGSMMATFTMFTDIGIALGMWMMGALGDQWGYLTALQCVNGVVCLGVLGFIVGMRQKPGSETTLGASL